ACMFELYCRDSHLILDKNKVLAYVQGPKNDINAIIPGFFGHEEDLKNKNSFLRDYSWAQADTVRVPCLQQACMYNDKQIIYALLQRKDVDVNERNRRGITALGYACIKGTADIVQLLLQHGADVNAEKDDGSTVLMGACHCDRQDAIKVLLACND
ncbi:MAG TPA: ankyrin repeat domain-containing protein, partial [Nitrosopumilaceae archaeon]|nr:ankyrin repeat domain-containing protein [Nitrosopumilaceae archaeon]